MNSKVLKILEYDKIINSLIDNADSDPGRSMCKSLHPMSDIFDIKKALDETNDAVSRIFRAGQTSFGSNYDMSSSLSALKIGSSLNMGELLKIASFLDNVSRIKKYGDTFKSGSDEGDTEDENVSEGSDSLFDYFEGLIEIPGLSKEIYRCIISEDEMSPDASSNLKRIIREISSCEDKIRSVLNSMITGMDKDYLQDAVITMRGDRYCIPVRADQKNSVKGIVHDRSSSGQTLFVEPEKVVELNNKLRTLEIEEKKEIEKILADLSNEASAYVIEIGENNKIMTHLDFVFAKAKLALEQKAMPPKFNDIGEIYIKKARHPLIDPDSVVPIDVYIGRNFKMLILTGPNTGGKTVTLKTVGLLTLMGQSGLMIPAGDNSHLSVFNEIYADIGDEQSIEQSLSTFSSHMTNIVKILENATDEDMVLLDEPCAGTDPTEGAALAISILDNLKNKNITTFATTHYSEIKLYAMSTDNVKNASCEFDVDTLSPTYRLLIGMPGKSNAFAISKKLGLSDEIINAANAQIDDDNQRFEDIIADLEHKRKRTERDKLRAKQNRQKSERLQRELSEKYESIDKKREEILDKARMEADEILADAKKFADETIRAFRKAGESFSINDLERERTKLNEKIAASKKNKRDDKKEAAPTHKILKPSQLKLGESVKIVSMNLKGTLSAMPDSKGNLRVRCGIMEIDSSIRDIVKIKDAEDEKFKQKFSRDAHKMNLSSGMSISHEINLIGQNSDDAIANLSKYLDDAYMAHLSSVRVVHGKGAGILRNAVSNYLKKSSYVKSFESGAYGEGDSGVTIVTFK